MVIFIITRQMQTKQKKNIEASTYETNKHATPTYSVASTREMQTMLYVSCLQFACCLSCIFMSCISLLCDFDGPSFSCPAILGRLVRRFLILHFHAPRF